MPSNPHRSKARRSQGGSGSSEGSSQQPLPSRWALREGPASAGAPGQPWGACRAALGLCALGFPSFSGIVDLSIPHPAVLGTKNLRNLERRKDTTQERLKDPKMQFIS